jgi:hypothetical protein
MEGEYWSEEVVRQGVWLSGQVSYEAATAILERVGGLSVPRTSVWRQSQDWGKRMKRQEEKERSQAMALPMRWEQWHPVAAAERCRLGAAMDGAMVHVRGEGWKELKVGCVFDIAVQFARAEHTGEPLEVARAAETSYVAHLGGTGSFGELVWKEARRRHWDQALDTQVIGDGAPWIWNLANLHFGDSHQVVDWYHAKDHLAAAVRLFHPDDETAFGKQLASLETLLYRGHARQLADSLDQAAVVHPDQAEGLHREATYFRTNQRRMNYMELREGRWLIGSGAVESGAKQYKHRFTGPGMRWSRKGIENLIPIRSAFLSGRFDDVWDTVKRSPPN